MKEIINQITESITRENSLFIIKTVLHGKHTSPIIEIFIDNETGVNAKLCAEISSLIKDKISHTKIADLNYKLIVSSPGVEEPLKYLGQFKKHLGRKFDLTYIVENETKNMDAKLLEIKDDFLVFQVNKELIEVHFNNIKKAKVKISF